MDGLKQRIIGALVLVCLAVIFVPMIFDEPHSERQATPITIPEEPPFPEVDMRDEPVMETEGYGLESNDAPAPSEETIAQAEPEPEPQRASEQTGNETETSPGYRLIEDSGTDDSAATEEPVQEKPAAEEQPAEFVRSLEGAWVVQLGSFGKQSNAQGLRDKVIELGYDAHLQQAGSGESRLTRVFSGPFADKADAEDAKRELDDEFGLDSLVTRGGK